MKKTVITHSDKETEKAAFSLAEAIKESGDKRAFCALFGEMGVGKTAFVRGFASALDINGVRSPTYTVVNEYPGAVPIFHFDLYRIDDLDALYSIGYYDYLEHDGYILTEWSENIPSEIPKNAIRVTISRLKEDDNTRIIEIEGDDKYVRSLS